MSLEFDRKALKVMGMFDGLEEVRSVLEARRSGLPLSSDDIKEIGRFFIALAKDDVEEINKIVEGVPRNWIIIVEEAHRFQEDKNFNALVVEARKFTKKLILITTDWKPWDGKAIIYKPPALDILLQKLKA